MKFISILVIIFIANPVFSQSAAEKEVLNLSANIFKWEIENKINSLDALMSEKLSVVTSRGDIQNKDQYLKTLSSGNLKHDSVAIEKSMVTIVNNTATVIGRGKFYMTVSGSKIHRHLSYMEVFVKEKRGWILIALYASALPEQQ
jgi:hypothetical protein